MQCLYHSYCWCGAHSGSPQLINFINVTMSCKIIQCNYNGAFLETDALAHYVILCTKKALVNMKSVLQVVSQIESWIVKEAIH